MQLCRRAQRLFGVDTRPGRRGVVGLDVDPIAGRKTLHLGANRFCGLNGRFELGHIGDNRFRVTGRLDGNFPGGTANLNFHFTLAGGLISYLKIAP